MEVDLPRLCTTAPIRAIARWQFSQTFSSIFIQRRSIATRFVTSTPGAWAASPFILFIVLTFTGVLLMFYYHPTKVDAFRDILYLEHDVPFGKLLRNMHRWAAHLMVITTWLHMFRVVLTGSYKRPREFNWGVGVVLLVLTLLLSFTGYLLPDDQLGFWAVTVGTNMARATPMLGSEGPFGVQLGMTQFNDVRFGLLGGSIVDSNALLRSYIWHCIGIPLVASIFMAVHFWRIRKDGGISGPAPVMLESEMKAVKKKT